MKLDEKKIYLVAPSFGCTTEPYKTRLKVAIKNLEKVGFKVVKGKNIFKNDGVVASSSPLSRGEEFEDAFFNSGAKYILSVGGGELMDEMLPFVDFKKIKESNIKDKVFIGFSDNTNLTFTLTTLCDLTTIYGINAPNFYEYPFTYDTLDLYEILSKNKKEFKGYKFYDDINKYKDLDINKEDLDPLAKREFTLKKKIIAKNYKEEVKGVILGGCLDILTNLVGTKYDNLKEYISKQKDGIIWYIEACDLTPLSIRRALFQLEEAGWFKNAKMFLFGRHLCNDLVTLGINKYNAVDILDLTSKNIPYLLDIDLGHISPTLPFINGKTATIKYSRNNIFIKYLD